MTKRIVVEQAAEEDLIETAAYILSDSPQSAERFIRAAQESFQHLAEQPEMGRAYQTKDERLAGVRVWRVKGFEKYLIFYRLGEELIFVERVIYGGRDLERILDGDA